MRSIKLLFAIILVLSLSRGLMCEDSMSNIYGKVVDAETKEPVKDIKVFINALDENGDVFYSKTDENGEFVFKQFPAIDYDFEITLEKTNKSRYDVDARYFDQRHTASFQLPKGKNLILKPIELQPGTRVNGQILLPEGKTADVARITFIPANFLQNDYYTWTSVSPITDGSYLSQLLPKERELLLIVDNLSKDGTGYVGVKKTFIIEKDSSGKSMDIEIPDTQTEIKGIVVDRLGNPLPNQVVGIYGNCGISVNTDANGEFCIRSIPPGTADLFAIYS
ncbi:MAG: carboxypeptidase regulatory-like domain-containing protein, partial [bacterium]|nr:carboxypeptidase regulatory-like domain-containing protein [bacterium]